MFELMDAYSQNAVIKVIGVGGGGGNAVSHMVDAGIEGVDFICTNTDAQALKGSRVRTSLQIGCNITKGLGAGANPDVGRQAAMEDRDRIQEVIEGADMLFITAGMGGGTGTGATPIVAQVAKELGILTVAVVTKPFNMEGNKRMAIADHGIGELGKYVDSLITAGLVPYTHGDVAASRLALLRPTHMVDYAMDIYRELHGADAAIPQEMEAQKADVLTKLEELRTGVVKFDEICQDEAEKVSQHGSDWMMKEDDDHIYFSARVTASCCGRTLSQCNST